MKPIWHCPLTRVCSVWSLERSQSRIFAILFKLYFDSAVIEVQVKQKEETLPTAAREEE